VNNARPTHQTEAGSAYLQLRRIARQQGRFTEEYLRHYILECFLARLAGSSHADKLVVKGGVLLAAYAIRRPTADIDIAARRVPGEIEQVRQIMSAIAGQPGPDGVVFETATALAEQIRGEDQHAGVRVTMTAWLATAKIRFHVDVNIGDPIWPEPELVRLPRVLGGEIVVRGYPVAMVLAEKIVTMYDRGTANTRWRDFADVYLLTGVQSVAVEVLITAALRVARHRGVELSRLAEVLDGFSEPAQPKWLIWRERQALVERLPVRFAEVLDAVCEFAEVLQVPNVTGFAWEPTVRHWALN